jgi:UTP:GlnB (protein PII) uridylyltransferase
MLASRNAREVVIPTDIAVASSIKDDQRESVNLSISQVVSSANEKVIKEPKTLVIVQEAEEAIATPVRNVYEESREVISINTKIGTKEKVIKQSNMVGILKRIQNQLCIWVILFVLLKKCHYHHNKLMLLTK